MWSPSRDSRCVLSGTLGWERVLLRRNRVRAFSMLPCRYSAVAGNARGGCCGAWACGGHVPVCEIPAL